MKTIDLKTATAAELLAFYNAHSGLPAVKRFSDRAAAVKRCAALLASSPKAAAKQPKALRAPKAAKIAPATHESRSAAIAQSWQDPATAAARAARYAVSTGGAQYKSLPAAFAALGLPLSKVIHARAQLRDAGHLTTLGHTFKLA